MEQADDEDQQTTLKELQTKGWLRIEQQLTLNQQRVSQSMLELADQCSELDDLQKFQNQNNKIENYKQQSQELRFVNLEGEYQDLYVENKVQEFLIEKKVIKLLKNQETQDKPSQKNKKKDTNKKNKKKGKNLVYEEQALKSLKNQAIKGNELIHNYYQEKKQDNPDLILFFVPIFEGKNLNFLELKLINFFHLNKMIRRKFREQKDTGISKDIEKLGFEIIIFLNKLLQGLEQNQIQISPSLIADIKFTVLEGLIKILKFTKQKMIEEYSQLLVQTRYDRYFDVFKVRPYKNQIQFMETIQKNIGQPFLIFQKNMIGSGKTTSCLALAQFIKNKGNKTLIFCSEISAVRYDMAQLLQHANISYHIAIFHQYKHQKKFVKATRNFKFQDVNNPTVIICDFSVCYQIFEENIKQLDYILFCDEPLLTQYLDKFTELVEYAPSQLILSSASLPEQEEIPSFIKMFKMKYQNALILPTLRSNEFKIGAQFLDFNNQVFLPHNDASDQQQFQQILNKIDSNPSLQKPYMPKNYIKINSQLLENENGEESKNQNSINNKDQFMKQLEEKNIEFFEQNNIQKELLMFLKNNQQNFKQFNSNLNQQKTEQNQKNKFFQIDNLATYDSYKFLQGCLIVTKNPLEFAKYCFIEKYNHRSKTNSYLKELQEYNEFLEIYDQILQAQKEAIYQEKQTGKKPIECVRVNNKKYNVYEDYSRTMPVFEQQYQINSFEHLSKYNNSLVNKIPKNELRKDIMIKADTLDQLINYQNVDQDLIYLMHIGVGVYSRYQNLEEDYLNEIQDIACLQQAGLAYIVSDETLCYGANFPFSNIIIFDDIGTQLSFNQLFQVMGRAGRFGQSQFANIYLETETYKRIQQYLLVNEINEESQSVENQSQQFIIQDNEIIQTSQTDIQKQQDIQFINQMIQFYFEEVEQKIDTEEENDEFFIRRKRIKVRNCFDIFQTENRIFKNYAKKKLFQSEVNEKEHDMKQQANNGNLGIEHGNKYEEKALDHYKKQFPIRKVTGKGLFQKEFLIGEPDGIVEHNNQKGCIEIKCPFTFKKYSKQTLISQSRFHEKYGFFMNYDQESKEFYLQRHHRYYYQVQAYLWITDFDFCDFVVYIAEAQSPYSIIERILPDKQFFCQKVYPIVQDYYFRYYLPNLLKTSYWQENQSYLQLENFHDQAEVEEFKESELILNNFTCINQSYFQYIQEQLSIMHSQKNQKKNKQ